MTLPLFSDDPAPAITGLVLTSAEALLGRRVDVVTVASLHPLLRGRVLSEARALGVIAAA